MLGTFICKVNLNKLKHTISEEIFPTGKFTIKRYNNTFFKSTFLIQVIHCNGLLNELNNDIIMHFKALFNSIASSYIFSSLFNLID